MRMPTLVRSWMVAAMAAFSMGTVGCSADYWTQAISVSTVRADVAERGEIKWQVTRDELGDITEAKSTLTDPSITLTLDANSSPVTYTTAQADFFYTEGTTNDAGKLATNPMDISTQYFPFATLLKPPGRSTEPTVQTIKLSGLIPAALVNRTNQTEDGFEQLTAVVATVKLTGTNGFGARITTTVSVPITISYQ